MSTRYETCSVHERRDFFNPRARYCIFAQQTKARGWAIRLISVDVPSTEYVLRNTAITERADFEGAHCFAFHPESGARTII